MPLTLDIYTAQEVGANGKITIPSRLLAKLELHLPDNTTLDNNSAQDLRNQLLDIAVNYALGPGEVVQ